MNKIEKLKLNKMFFISIYLATFFLPNWEIHFIVIITSPKASLKLCYETTFKNVKNPLFVVVRQKQLCLSVVIHSDKYLMEILRFEFNDSSCVTSTIYNHKNSPSFPSKQHDVEKWLP